MFKRLSCLLVVLALFIGGLTLPVVASASTADDEGSVLVAKKGGKKKGGKKKGKRKGKKKGGKKKGGKKKKAATEV